MTNEEALQELKSSIVGCGFQCHIETYQMAIEALKKQIPKRPTGDYPFYCPTCEAKLMPDPYCGMCGQMIDWKEMSYD